MADRFNAIIQEYLEPIWTAGNAAHERYAYATALFFYDGESSYSHITHRLKYDGQLSVGRHFGRMLGDEVRLAPWLQDVDAIVPVPLHWCRRWRRGYNQAEIIAEAVSDVLEIPIYKDILTRHKYTKTQTLLDVNAKADNVRGAFTADKTGDREIRHILLVDDVFTTGSTLLACFTALREVFPPSVRISIATLGFVGRR
jgi:ComF family protein